MASRYTGAWARRALVPPGAALKPPLDPRHHTAQAVDQRAQDWHQDTQVALLPGDVYGDQLVQGPVVGGLVDHTPWDHEDGVGYGAGLTTQQAQDLRGVMHSRDDGNLAATHFQVMDARDGAYHVDLIPDRAQQDGFSPANNHYREPGVGSSIDPYARSGRRIWRWRDRFIDRHMWDSQPHPSARRQAYTAPVQPPSPSGGAGVSPFVAGTIEYAERWAVPQDRVSPRPWDQAMTVQGVTPGGAADFGLTTYGL